jgi:hypothetical protein
MRKMLDQHIERRCLSAGTDAAGLRNRLRNKIRVADGRQAGDVEAAGKSVLDLLATSSARRVLPIPPGPVNVTSRAVSRATT